MKKGDLRDLIVSHYTGDDTKFFNTTLKLLKELKENGDVELEKDIELCVLSNVKIRQKSRPISTNHEISWEDAEYFNLVPQESNDE